MERNGDVIVGNWYDDKDQWYPLTSPDGEVGSRFAFTGEGLTCSMHLIKKEAGYLPRPPLHDHPHEQFLTILEGGGEVVIGDKRYPASPGSFFVIPSGLPHNFEIDPAMGDTWNFDTFCPSRKDYLKEEWLKTQKP